MTTFKSYLIQQLLTYWAQQALSPPKMIKSEIFLCWSSQFTLQEYLLKPSIFKLNCGDVIIRTWILTLKLIDSLGTVEAKQVKERVKCRWTGPLLMVLRDLMIVVKRRWELWLFSAAFGFVWLREACERCDIEFSLFIRELMSSSAARNFWNVISWSNKSRLDNGTWLEIVIFFFQRVWTTMTSRAFIVMWLVGFWNQMTQFDHLATTVRDFRQNCFPSYHVSRLISLVLSSNFTSLRCCCWPFVGLTRKRKILIFRFWFRARGMKNPYIKQVQAMAFQECICIMLKICSWHGWFKVMNFL